MPSTWVRALCAQIAIELDPQKVDLLTRQLADVILREYVSGRTLTDQEVTSDSSHDESKVH